MAHERAGVRCTETGGTGWTPLQLRLSLFFGLPETKTRIKGTWGILGGIWETDLNLTLPCLVAESLRLSSNLSVSVFHLIRDHNTYSTGLLRCDSAAADPSSSLTS